MSVFLESDYQFIVEHCPNNLVPTFFIRESYNFPEMHKVVKAIYRKAELELDRNIPIRMYREILPNQPRRGGGHLIAYYATPQDRAVMYKYKYKLMTFYAKQTALTPTFCYSFNDKNEPVDTLSVPIGKVNSKRDVNEILDDLQQFMYKGATLRTRENDDGSLSIVLLLFPSHIATIASLASSHGVIQTVLLDIFGETELSLCDINGNVYPKDQQREHIALNTPETPHRFRLFHITEYNNDCKRREREKRYAERSRKNGKISASIKENNARSKAAVASLAAAAPASNNSVTTATTTASNAAKPKPTATSSTPTDTNKHNTTNATGKTPVVVTDNNSNDLELQ